MRILLVGPCGVGKTAVASLMASRIPGLAHIDLDQARFDGVTVRPGCWLSEFDVDLCLGPLLDSAGSNFVVDVGGDTVFREGADNARRLEQLRSFTAARNMSVVLLDGSREVVYRRFISCKSRKPGEFDATWAGWVSFGRPYWTQVADRVVDTDGLSIMDDNEVGSLLRQIMGSSRQA